MKTFLCRDVEGVENLLNLENVILVKKFGRDYIAILLRPAVWVHLPFECAARLYEALGLKESE